MRKFDIEKAKSGEPVCTLEGTDVEILKFNAKYKYPIIGLIKYNNNINEEYPYSWGINGKSHYESRLNLFMKHNSGPYGYSDFVSINYKGKTIYGIIKDSELSDDNETLNIAMMSACESNFHTNCTTSNFEVNISKIKEMTSEEEIKYQLYLRKNGKTFDKNKKEILPFSFLSEFSSLSLYSWIYIETVYGQIYYVLNNSLESTMINRNTLYSSLFIDIYNNIHINEEICSTFYIKDVRKVSDEEYKNINSILNEHRINIYDKKIIYEFRPIRGEMFSCYNKNTNETLIIGMFDELDDNHYFKARFIYNTNSEETLENQIITNDYFNKYPIRKANASEIDLFYSKVSKV